jgi:hypothetical protein
MRFRSLIKGVFIRSDISILDFSLLSLFQVHTLGALVPYLV